MGFIVSPKAQVAKKEVVIMGVKRQNIIVAPSLHKPADSLFAQLNKLERNIKHANLEIKTIQQYCLTRKDTLDYNNIDSNLLVTDPEYRKKINFVQRVIQSVKHKK